MIYLISVAILVLILVIPIDLKIENKVHSTYVKIRICYVFTFYVDYSKIYKMFVTSKDERHFISIREIIENTRKLKSVYPLFERFARHSVLKQIRITNRYSDDDPMLAVSFYTTNAMISNYLHGLFGKVLSEEYIVSNENEFDVDFLCITKVRLVNTMIVLIEHINKIPLLIKRAT